MGTKVLTNLGMDRQKDSVSICHPPKSRTLTENTHQQKTWPSRAAHNKDLPRGGHAIVPQGTYALRSLLNTAV